MSALDPIPYSDAKLRRILSAVRTIAMVGASSNWNRPSYFVMKYLQGKGYRVIPVNPGTAGQQQLGEKIYASLRDVPDKIDMVDIFRASDQVGPIGDAAWIRWSSPSRGCALRARPPWPRPWPRWPALPCSATTPASPPCPRSRPATPVMPPPPCPSTLRW